MKKVGVFFFSWKGLVALFSLFFVYAIGRYYLSSSNGEHASDQQVIRITIILLLVQAASLATIVLLVRAYVESRFFEILYVLLVAVPLISVTSNAAFFAEEGTKHGALALLRQFDFGPVFWGLILSQAGILLFVLLHQKFKSR